MLRLLDWIIEFILKYTFYFSYFINVRILCYILHLNSNEVQLYFIFITLIINECKIRNNVFFMFFMF